MSIPLDGPPDSFIPPPLKQTAG